MKHYYFCTMNPMLDTREAVGVTFTLYTRSNIFRVPSPSVKFGKIIELFSSQGKVGEFEKNASNQQKIREF